MSSVPTDYIDDLRSIILATLNRIEQLRMRVLFGVDIIKGSYGQELQFKSDGKVYIDDVEIGDVAWDTQSFTNLLSNGDFGSWSAGVTSNPDGWLSTRIAANYPARSATEKTGTYSAAIKWDGVTGSDCALYRDISNYEYYKSRTVTMGGWVKAGSASKVKLELGDGVATQASSLNTGTEWEWLTVTLSVNASATRIRPVFKSTDTADVLCDGAILVEGSVCPAFSPKPLVDDGKTIAINSVTNVTTFGGNINIDGSNLIDADSIIADTATDLTLTVDTGRAFIFSKV